MVELAPNQSSSVKQMNILEVNHDNIIAKYGNKKCKAIGFVFLILGIIIVTIVLATTLKGRFLKSLSN